MPASSRTQAYSALGLAPGAVPAEIKRAFRRLAMHWHPDRNAGAEAAERFRQVKAAHDLLIRGGGADTGPDDVADDMAEPDAAPVRGPDQQEMLWLTVEEAIFGDVQVLELTRPEPCDECDGTGRITLASSRMCACCRGSGRVQGRHGLVRCDVCGGRGYSAEAACEACEGSGERRAGRKLRVTVPAGMWPGRTLRVAGKAQPVGDLPPGDLLLVCQLRLHGLFALRGEALEVRVPVPLFALLAGEPVTVPVPGGETVCVEVPAGTAVETCLELPGQGLPLRSGGRGALHVVMQPVLPEALGKTDIAALRALQAALAGREAKLYPALAEWRATWLGMTPRKSGKKSRKKAG
ncbi:DnaJ C-terminal domain-containing protein [Denitromonas iodatirespirans]|uniref:J domain-containing protein n=1 Tax=Denitromonas iodatirespirans TaxID=2795389 RepID=A0A944DIW7_DENI1|nr:J domain-containing protein [Denitromonas iodatirespirans]MBT0959689.1 J domain-containing protein [Denitromonas iodatirespirans]